MTVSVLKTWGYEIPVCNGPYAAKFLYVKRDCYCSDHRHAKKDETFLIIRGTIRLLWKNGAVKYLHVGDVVHIPPRVWHKFMAVKGDSIILEVSTHDDSNDTERRSPSIAAPPETVCEFLRRERFDGDAAAATGN